MIQENERLEVVEKITLAKAIGRKMGFTIVDAMRIIDIFEEEIVDAIKENKKVQLNGFLIFTPKNVDESTIVSPLDNKEYKIPAKRTVVVKVGKNFKDDIKDSYKGKEENNDNVAKPKGSKRKSNKNK